MTQQELAKRLRGHSRLSPNTKTASSHRRRRICRVSSRSACILDRLPQRKARPAYLGNLHNQHSSRGPSKIGEGPEWNRRQGNPDWMKISPVAGFLFHEKEHSALHRRGLKPLSLSFRAGLSQPATVRGSQPSATGPIPALRPSGRGAHSTTQTKTALARRRGCTDIVDVCQCGPGANEIAESIEQTIAIVFRQHG